MPPALPTPPATLDDFKARFARDFKYGSGPETVMDADIKNAMIDAMAVFNPALFSVADGWLGFLFVTAHFVRINIEAAGGLTPESEGLGVENQAEQVLTGSGVNGISQNFQEPPEWVKKIPLLQQLWITTYGQKYVAMVQPKLVGAMAGVVGRSDFTGGVPGKMPSIPFTDS
ncbi:MAG: hypothetical protein V4510_10095 [bacterium]